jgi:cyclic pyranopterin phosphate synthase
LSLRDYLLRGDVSGLQGFITEKLADKKVSHYLQDGVTGITKNLSMLGG